VFARLLSFFWDWRDQPIVVKWSPDDLQSTSRPHGIDKTARLLPASLLS
jgi:hypothetical protein